MKKLFSNIIKDTGKEDFINQVIRVLFKKTLQEQEQNQPIMYPEVNIVSLGCNCIARTILTRHNIKPRKSQGELSCPFDLAIHHTKRVSYYLENDFEGYFDDLKCEPYKRNFLDFRGRGVWSKNDGTKFNHDKDCGVKDHDKLVNRIESRIKNLRSILNSDKPILFVQGLVDNEDVENLYNVLSKLRNGKDFRLLIYDFKHNISKSYENIKIVDIPYPTSDYRRNWNRPKYYNSEDGKKFEEIIATETINVLEDMKKNLQN